MIESAFALVRAVSFKTSNSKGSWMSRLTLRPTIRAQLVSTTLISLRSSPMCKSLRFSFASLLVISMCALMALAQSQASTGQIVGTVKSPVGELVPGATITVTNPATGLSRTSTTNDQGGFTAVNLPSGEYTIDVEAQGFGKFTQTGYKVEVGSAITADINLSVQGVTGTVLVSAGVNVVTKSGTNDLHGGAFYVDRSTGLAAKNAFGQIAAPTQQQFGGSVGGPFPIPRFGEGGKSHYGGKDKSFFFVAYEQQKLLQSRAVLFNTLRAAGITTGTIATGIDELLNFSLGSERAYAQTNDAKVFLMRFDFNISQKN